MLSSYTVLDLSRQELSLALGHCFEMNSQQNINPEIKRKISLRIQLREVSLVLSMSAVDVRPDGEMMMLDRVESIIRIHHHHDWEAAFWRSCSTGCQYPWASNTKNSHTIPSKTCRGDYEQQTSSKKLNSAHFVKEVARKSKILKSASTKKTLDLRDRCKVTEFRIGYFTRFDVSLLSASHLPHITILWF